MSQFLAYCLIPVDGSWTPPVHLETAEECFHYCLMHHVWTPEIRVTDAEDFLVLHALKGVLKCPMPDGTLKEWPLG